jgi:hypothetical protein
VARARRLAEQPCPQADFVAVECLREGDADVAEAFVSVGSCEGVGVYKRDGRGRTAYSRAWVLMRELMGLASVFFGCGLEGEDGEWVGVGCLTLIMRVPIFTVAMVGVLLSTLRITVEWVTALMVELWNGDATSSGCGFRPRDTASSLQSITRSGGLRPEAPHYSTCDRNLDRKQ